MEWESFKREVRGRPDALIQDQVPGLFCYFVDQETSREVLRFSPSLGLRRGDAYGGSIFLDKLCDGGYASANAFCKDGSALRYVFS